MAGPLSPGSFPPGDMPRTDFSGLVFETSGTFTCDQAGDWEIKHSGFANFSYSAEPIDPPEGASLPSIQPGDHGSLFNPKVAGECVGATATEVPRTSGNRAPFVSPIRASVLLPTTSYTIAATDPDNDPLTIQWSGPNCGSVGGSTTTTMAWTHDDDDCAHDTTTHDDVQIVVLVSDGLWEVRCTYQGGGANGASACEEPGLVP